MAKEEFGKLGYHEYSNTRDKSSSLGDTPETDHPGR